MRIAEEIAHSKGPKEEIVVAVVVVQPITLPFTANSPEATNLRVSSDCLFWNLTEGWFH